MKQRSKVVLTTVGVLAIVGITTAAIACDGDRERGKHRYDGAKVEKHFERMKEHLNLTDQQALQISAVFEAKKNAKSDHRSERKAMRQAVMKLDPSAADYEQRVDQLAREQAETMVQKIKAHAQTRKQIHDILTPEQQEKAEEMHEKRMERSKDHHGSGRWG
ncbi:MAG: Spy/CpxP family protein refolding chaperone [Mariprofundaceae bacterium]